MTLPIALFLSYKLLFLSFLIQAAEIFFLSKQPSFQKIWSYSNLSPDLESGLPLKNSLVEKVFSTKALTRISGFQLMAAGFGLIFPHWIGLALVLFTQLIIGIRFRGSFNGGSDMMTIVVATGLLISLAGSSEKTQTLGLIYISVHTLYSYFKSGASKLSQPDWRQGKAISGFLKRSVFNDIQSLATSLSAHTFINITVCWLVIIFELASLLLLAFPNAMYLYFASALCFHLVIYFAFGLNRFFWIWLSAWPATLYSISLLVSK